MRDSSPLQPTADDELRQLMRRYQAGEVEAFEEIYARTLTMVRGYLAALTVDRSLTLDLVQDVYLQMHRSRQTYDPTRPVRPWVAGSPTRWLMPAHARTPWNRPVRASEAIDRGAPASKDSRARCVGAGAGGRALVNGAVVFITCTASASWIAPRRRVSEARPYPPAR